MPEQRMDEAFEEALEEAAWKQGFVLTRMDARYHLYQGGIGMVLQDAYAVLAFLHGVEWGWKEAIGLDLFTTKEDGDGCI